MTVRSGPVSSAQPSRRHFPATPITSIFIGILLWPIGGRYTVDGVIWLVNRVLEFTRIPIQIPPILNLAIYLPLFIVPYLCSRVEWHWPLRRVDGRWRIDDPDTVVTWLLVAAFDLITTYIGIRNPAPDAWEISQELSKMLAASAIVSILLTFTPEWLIRSGARKVRG